MKLLIAGDSYAEAKEYSWSNMLQESTGWQIKNIAFSGTSLSWTYKQLKKHKLEDYDKVLVFVTAPGRLYCNNNVHPSNYTNTLRNFERLTATDKNYQLFLAAKLYYENFYDEELEQLYFKYVLFEIANLSNNVILHRSFYDGDGYGLLPFDLNLKDISNYEENKYHKKWRLTHEETEYRSNHLSLPNKKVLVKYIEDILTKGNSDITLESFHTLSDDEFNFYFRKTR